MLMNIYLEARYFWGERFGGIEPEPKIQVGEKEEGYKKE